MNELYTKFRLELYYANFNSSNYKRFGAVIKDSCMGFGTFKWAALIIKKEGKKTLVVSLPLYNKMW